MKNPFGFYSVLLMVVFSLSHAYSQTTGWQDNGTYKYMQIPKFEKLQFSPDGERFYTYSKDNYIRYFESESGKQVDSFLITYIIEGFYFSSDGRTAIHDSIITYSKCYYHIFDLQLKKYIFHDFENKFSDLYVYNWLLDYNYKANKIFIYQDIYSGGADKGYIWSREDGRLFSIDLNNNEYKRKEIFFEGANKFYNLNGDSLYIISDSRYRIQKGNYSNSSSQVLSYIYDIPNDTLFLSDPVPNITESPYQEPDNILYSTNLKNILQQRYDRIYYLDPSNKKVLFFRNLLDNSTFIEQTSNSNFIVQYDGYNKLWFYNNNLEVMDSLKLTSYRYKFRIFPKNDDIIMYDTSTGKMLRYSTICSKDSIKFITVKNVIHTQDTVSIYNSSNIQAKKYKWYINNSQVSESNNLMYVFDTPGDYDVKLEIIDTNNKSHILSKLKYFRVIEKLQPSFTSDFVTGNAPMIVRYQNNSKGNYGAVKWYFGDGDSSLQVNPEHFYKQSGLYTVTLIIQDELEIDTLIMEHYININSVKAEKLENIVPKEGITHGGYGEYPIKVEALIEMLNFYSDYKNNIVLTYKTYNSCILDIWSKKFHNISFELYNAQHDTLNYTWRLPNSQSNTNETIFIVNQYDSCLIFSNSNIYFIGNEISYHKYFNRLSSEKELLSHIVKDNLHLFLYKYNLIHTEDTLIKTEFVYSNIISNIQKSIQIAFSQSGNYLLYYLSDKYYLAKFNKNSLISNTQLFDPNLYELDNCIGSNKSENLVLCGSKKEYGKSLGCIVVINKNGDILREFIIGDCSNMKRMHELPDGNILIASYGKNSKCFILDQNKLQITQNYSLEAKRDSIVFTDAVPSNDSTILFLGYIDNIKSKEGSDILIAKSKYYIYKCRLDHKIFDSSITSSKDTLKNDTTKSTSGSKFALFPNPSYNKITLNLPEIAEGAKIEVFNAMGVIVGEYIYLGNSGAYTIDISGLPIGIYYTKVISGSRVINGKFVKVE